MTAGGAARGTVSSLDDGETTSGGGGRTVATTCFTLDAGAEAAGGGFVVSDGGFVVSDGCFTDSGGDPRDSGNGFVDSGGGSAISACSFVGSDGVGGSDCFSRENLAGCIAGDFLDGTVLLL